MSPYFHITSSSTGAMATAIGHPRPSTASFIFKAGQAALTQVARQQSQGFVDLSCGNLDGDLVSQLAAIWGFPEMEVPKIGWSLRENAIKMMAWGYPYFRKPPFTFLCFFACLCSSDNQFGDKKCAKSECITRLQRTLNFSFPASTNHSPVLRSGRSAASRPASWRGKVTELILVALLHRHFSGHNLPEELRLSSKHRGLEINLYKVWEMLWAQTEDMQNMWKFPEIGVPPKISLIANWILS